MFYRKEIERKRQSSNSVVIIFLNVKHAITSQKKPVTSRYLLSIPRYEKANILGANWFTTE